MTSEKMLLNSNLSLLGLAKELNNIKKTCNTSGVSRQHYYNVKKMYDKYGVEGLKPKSRSRPKMPNQTKSKIEFELIEYSLDNPVFGKDRVADTSRYVWFVCFWKTVYSQNSTHCC